MFFGSCFKIIRDSLGYRWNKLGFELIIVELGYRVYYIIFFSVKKRFDNKKVKK